MDKRLSCSRTWGYHQELYDPLKEWKRKERNIPNIQWVDSDTSMFYNKSASSIYTAISDRGNGYIY